MFSYANVSWFLGEITGPRSVYQPLKTRSATSVRKGKSEAGDLLDKIKVE